MYSLCSENSTDWPWCGGGRDRLDGLGGVDRFDRLARLGFGLADHVELARLDLREQFAELLGDPPDLRVPGLAADAGEHVRNRQAGRGQEHPGQLGVSVLAGMDEPGLPPQNAHNMRQLNYFRACAYDDGDMR